MVVGGVAALLALKLLAYAGWCWVGLRTLTPARPEGRRALSYGALRLLLGLVLGTGFVALLATFAPERNRLGVSPLALVVGFVALRFVEWAVVGLLLTRSAWSARDVAGAGIGVWLWRAGGVGVSFATDVGALLGVGGLGLMPC